MGLCGPQRSPSAARRIGDGLALALLVAAVFCAESLDNARQTLTEAAAVAKPPHFVLVWTLVALAGGLAGAYVACRVVRIAGAVRFDWRRHSLVRTGHKLL